MSEVRIIKLITGEELVSEIESRNGSTLTLKNPMRIIATRDGLGMAPYSVLSKDTSFNINGDHVTCISNPEEEVLNGYNSKFGSGIVIPTGNSGLQLEGF